MQDCLNGEFVRVGPNPKFEPVAGHHLYVSFFPVELFAMIYKKFIYHGPLSFFSSSFICV